MKAIVVVLAVALTGVAAAGPAGKAKLAKTEDAVEGGTHWRIATDDGAVHVWVPGAYDRATAGTVVYIHGYRTDADGAWQDHDLAAQFRASKQNALFVVPEAPSDRDEDVVWPRLSELRRAITRANLKLPAGPVIVMGHSGAFRTVREWVDHKLVSQIILLDAMYGGEEELDAFISTGRRAKQHKLIIVGSDTAEASEKFAQEYPFAVTRDDMPDAATDFTAKERKARLLYIRAQYGHMEIVTGGKVIPQLLRLTPLHQVGAANDE